MQYSDHTTNPDRIPAEVRPLVRGMLFNRQLLGTDHDGDPVTDAIKYTSEEQKRRLSTPYDGDDPFVDDILDIFDFDPLDFQVDSWQLINDFHQQRHDTGQPHAAILSAPTGFGKTEAFLGPLYQQLRNGEQDTTVIVYPRRALLQDQLGRILKHVHSMRPAGEQAPLSVGVYMGGMPYSVDDVRDDYFESENGQETFQLAHCWCGDENTTNAFTYDGSSNSYTIRCEAEDTHSFSNNELVLSRQRIKNGETPDILLTTLESLELFALKPNYDIIDDVDTFVLDEVHLYTRLRGAHAAKIIDNINDITDQPLLWVGASATIDNADRFIRKLFDFPSGHLATVDVPESDLKQDHNDKEHYYFLLSPEDGPGASSMMIQQLLLIGHGLLRDTDGNEGKALSFIDSISQVNQKKAQLDDAERGDSQGEPPLWHHHTDRSRRGQQPTNPEADWADIADAMGYDFIEDRALDFLPVYSQIGFDAEDAADSDIFLSTSFLEVGIDIGEIKHVTQYRTPQNLSSFVQRTGRAAREEGMDAHIFVFLSNLTNDANMFYRADRFLSSELRTPLKPDNDVIEWIHTTLNTYYTRASDIENRRIRRGEEEIFLEEFLTQDKQYQEFYQLLLNPSEFLLAEFDIDDTVEPLTTEAGIESFRDILNERETELEEEFAEVDDLINIDSGEITRSDNAFEQYVDEVRQRTLEVISHYVDIADQYQDHVDSSDASDLGDELDELRDEFEELREEARDGYRGAETERVERYEQLFGRIISAVGNLTGLRAQVNIHIDDRPEEVSLDRITDLSNAVDILSSIAGDGRLEENIDERYQIYYLRRVLDQLGEYRDLERDPESRVNRPHMSLHYVKHLLRAAYYLHRYLQVTDRTYSDEIWYVPPSYFDSSGQFFTVIGPDGFDDNEETIDSLVHSHAPYRSEFQNESTNLHVLLPPTEVENYGEQPTGNEVRFDFSDIPGDRRNGMLIPDSIQLSEIPDVTGQRALNIVAYCPQCLTLLDDQRCVRHNEIAWGKVHAEPQVRTVARDTDAEDVTGSLALAGLRGQVTLEGVSLDITPARPMGDMGIQFTGDDRIQREIDSPETPLGFDLKTRGLIYDLTDFVAYVEDNEDLIADVARYKNLDEVPVDELAYHTAAHFFLHLVADVGGVNPSMLFYGLDPEEGIVFIFERTEGGQGIVDLVYDELENDPGNLLESLVRITYNTQVINEQLWADPDFVDDLPEQGVDEDAVQRCIETHLDEQLDMVFPEIRGEVVQEVLSTYDRAAQLSDEENIPLRDAYTVKQTVAGAQLDGADAFPEGRVDALNIDLDELSRVESLFFSPDIDGCVENLHTGECISGHDQEEVLSHVLLQELRHHLVDFVDADDAVDEMFDREQVPAGEINDTSIYFTF